MVPPIRRRGSVISVLVGLIVVVAIVIAAYWLRIELDRGDPADTAHAFTVQRGSFDVTIPCAGELAALRQVEIRNKLESGATITYIAPEGTTVEQGDDLIRLAEDEILNRLKDAIDDEKTAQASLVAARARLEIAQSERESALASAELEVELSKLALQGWLEGEVVSMIEELALAWETAKINHARLRDKYFESIELQKNGFISADELRQDEIAMIEAKAKLDQANLDIDVFARYTYPEQEARMESAVEQALAELHRVRQRHAAELETARADVESRAYQVEYRAERVADLRRQHSYCSVKAPSAGLVVYASSLESSGHHHRDDEPPPQVGTELRPNELVILLPDTTQMMAAVKVNEALSGVIRPGQTAEVVSEALPDASLRGEVMSVGVLAEGGGWRDPNRRDYTVRIMLETPERHALKPSMRCRATVYVDRVEDVLYVPIKAVSVEQTHATVVVPEGRRLRRHAVLIGRSSNTYVEIVEGLSEGDRVLLRTPRPDELVASDGAVLTASR